ncbi:hypothetical protein Pcinc_040532 [Petrolisthes cinctipes]|uniref:Uncharacterized protein n=1 Tax=Petrolisthes cinctipes TaxID=88211 RepID=A0AAE1EEI5_PETCI|nr:hypothetical protein Pcinc_044392 [Petrolisthes cinctipes]KAK3852895.1 hypothetical protein Pcinc_040532 [Petrolisthes cinctipes]
MDGNASHIPLETTSTLYASEILGALLANMTTTTNNNNNYNYYYNNNNNSSHNHSFLDPTGDRMDSRLLLGMPLWRVEALGCTYETDNETIIRHDCMMIEDPLEMRKPHKANPSFVPIVVTHVLTFLVGVTGNSIIVATMAKDKGARNVTRPGTLAHTCSDS